MLRVVGLAAASCPRGRRWRPHGALEDVHAAGQAGPGLLAAAAAGGAGDGGGAPDPILAEVTDRLLDRLDDCARTFPVGLSLGGALCDVRRQLGRRGRAPRPPSASCCNERRPSRAAKWLFPGVGAAAGGVEKLVSLDSSEGMIARSRALVTEQPSREDVHLVGNDDELLPFEEESFDVIISSLGLHWVNDLPGTMMQCRMALRPDGLFLGAMELRIACTVAQLEREGGVSPRLSPLAQVRDAGNLLTRAGLALPTVDVDQFTVRYPSVIELVEHLRAMGESNAVLQRSKILKRDTALAAAATYQALFGEEDGTVPATFQVIYMAGWSPHSSQQRPRRRGSATVSLQDLGKALKQGPEAAKPAPTAAEEQGRVNLPSGSWYKID
eukprot:SM000309S11866  [mRNA]  locus=s309:26796:30755:+ [translate_table: standard]